MTFSVSDKHVVVAGGGRSGVAAAELLLARGARVTLSDISDSPSADRLRAQGVAVELGPHRPGLFAGADLVVLSPGVPSEQEAIAAARRAGVPVIGEIELAFRWLAGRVIAITGTKGKSTTTTLAALMLREAGLDATAGGNLGTALSTQVPGTHPGALHVVEVSSFQLEATDRFHPWIAVLLNLSADHLDRHGTVERYAAAKARIFANQTPDDWAIVNADDAASVAMAAGARARRFDFGMNAAVTRGVTLDAGHIVRRDGNRTEPLLPISSVRLPGRHLLADVMAAAAVACVAGAAPEAIRRAVERFEGLPHALERVAELDHVLFVNDSKATNIESARRSLESFPQGIVAIMGGRFKGGDFASLRDLVRERVAGIVAIGEAAPQIEQALGAVAPVRRAGSMRDAVSAAFALAPRPGVVLLAPACASFDMFRDYVDRGEQFRAAVRETTGTTGTKGTNGN
jgi:UDP-N-acetylmuramoylalanine--D-glutamate ligase